MIRVAKTMDAFEKLPPDSFDIAEAPGAVDVSCAVLANILAVDERTIRKYAVARLVVRSEVNPGLYRFEPSVRRVVSDLKNQIVHRRMFGDNDYGRNV